MPNPQTKKNSNRVIGAHNIHKPEEPLNVQESFKIQTKIHVEHWAWRPLGLIFLTLFLYVPYKFGPSIIQKLENNLGSN